MVRQVANMGSSPPSSTDATHFGTPSTNITAMSPDEGHSANRLGMRVNTQPARAAIRATQVPSSLISTAFANTYFNHSASNLDMPTPLSPTAAEFTPRNATFSLGALGPNISPIRGLVAGSMPDAFANPRPTHGAVGQGSNVVRDLGAKVAMTQSVQIVYGKFSTDDNVTRTFQIFDKSIPSLHYIITHFPVQFESLACIDSKHIDNGIVRLSFHDVQDAKQAYVLVASLTHPHCNLSQLTAKEVAIAHGKDPNNVTDYEGQILVNVFYNGRSVLPTVDQLTTKLLEYGSVKAIQTVPSNSANAMVLRVEYFDARHAKEAVKYMHTATFVNVSILVAPHEPDVRRTTNALQSAIQIVDRQNVPAVRNTTQPSLTGRTIVPAGALARHENVVARVMRETPYHGRGMNRTGHNVVDIRRIEAGIDVRTTIMLRNIPNRVDQATLKAILDESSLGDFDFMYLRIDFQNNCNVGYAFINFVDPLAIIPFARARAGQRWNIFQSEKVAEISYATIQGRDCLVQKFRNSSVLLEHPSFCPKLYYVHPSPLAGQEEAFPDPDNFSKMRRSLDNAEHIGLFYPSQGDQRRASAPANVRYNRAANPVATLGSTNTRSPTPRSWSSFSTRSSTDTGLFAPREGQAHREEQRRRRSQFDRGTPGAESELERHRVTDAALENTRAASARLTASLQGLNL